MPATKQHQHRFMGGNSKRRGTKIKRQCMTCPAWDKWRTYRDPRPDLTPPKKPKVTFVDAGSDLLVKELKEEMAATGVVGITWANDKPMTAAEMVEHDMHVNILDISARDPNTGYPLDDPRVGSLKDLDDELTNQTFVDTAVGSVEWVAQQQASLSTLTVAVLHELAAVNGLHVTTKTRKAALIDAIIQHRIQHRDKG
jgi:hypothetical protein